MKTQLYALSIALSSPFGLSLNASAEQISVFVTPEISMKGRAYIYGQITTLALSDIAPGDSIRVYCGLTQKPITHFKCPDSSFYKNNIEGRAKKMAPSIGSMKKWVKEKASKKESSLALNVPQCVRFATKNIPRDSNAETILFIGNPVFDLKASPAHAMRRKTEGKLYPSDGFLASGADTVYGVLPDEKKSLEGVSVRWAYLKDEFAGDTDWRSKTERWWHLFFCSRSASLRTATTSLPTVLQAIKANSQTFVSKDMPNLEEPMVMIELGDPKVEVVSQVEVEKQREKVELHALLVDCTISMRSRRHRVADEIEKLPIVDKSKIYQVYAFYDYDRKDETVPVAHLLMEGRDPKILGKAVRAAKFLEGLSDEEAIHEGLHSAMRVAEKRDLRIDQVTIFSDERPREVGEHVTPNQIGFRELIKNLSEADTKLVFYWMNPKQVSWNPPSGLTMNKL